MNADHPMYKHFFGEEPLTETAFIDKVRVRAMTTHDLARWLLERDDFLIGDSGEEGANPSEAWTAPMDLTDVPYRWPKNTDAISICILDHGAGEGEDFDYEGQTQDWKTGYELGNAGKDRIESVKEAGFTDAKQLLRGWEHGNVEYRANMEGICPGVPVEPSNPNPGRSDSEPVAATCMNCANKKCAMRGNPEGKYRKHRCDYQ